LTDIKYRSIKGYMEKTMRKIIAAILVTATLMPSVSYADWNGHHHHGGGYYRGGGGGDAGAALFGGLVGGLIIGGMLNSMNQPQYYQPQPYYNPYYQPVCNRYFAGRDIYGRPVFQTVCQ
jgi:hypothetical protein